MNVWWGLLIGSLATGPLLGVVLFCLLAGHAGRRAYKAGLDAGEAKTLLAHGLHPAMFEGCNPRETPMPRGRHRSPDTQLVTRTTEPRSTRPVFYR